MILYLDINQPENPYFNMFKFPGGETHIVLSKIEEHYNSIHLTSRINNNDDLINTILFVENIKESYPDKRVELYIPFFLYQQADRKFSKGESFTLKYVCKMLNNLNLDKITILDPHSDVTPALLNNCHVFTNEYFILKVLSILSKKYDDDYEADGHLKFSDKINENLVFLSPDAGAYKKIFNLANDIKFNGDIVCANKSRDSRGKITQTIGTFDFKGKDVLIIDDLTINSGTHLGLYDLIKERNVGDVYLAVTHMIKKDPNKDLDTTFKKVFTTDSRYDDYESNNINKITITHLNSYNNGKY